MYTCTCVCLTVQGFDVYYFRSPDYQFDENYIITEPNALIHVHVVFILYCAFIYCTCKLNTLCMYMYINRSCVHVHFDYDL